MKIALVIFCLIFSGCDQMNSSARYQLVVGSDGHAWKIDTTTGKVWKCYFASVNMSEKKANVTCFPVEQL